jgi:hypothetical protein
MWSWVLFYTCCTRNKRKLIIERKRGNDPALTDKLVNFFIKDITTCLFMRSYI